MLKRITLKPGDTVEIIAPASRCKETNLHALRDLLCSWQLKCHVDETIFGDDLLCANSDSKRFELLKAALQNPENKAIICVRGGYGSMRLIPELQSLSLPSTAKLLVGMSDNTALSLFLNQTWQWPTLHASLAVTTLTQESISLLKQALFDEASSVNLQGMSLNSPAKNLQTIQAPIIGGNLTLVQASVGTSWQLQAKDKIVLLEEIGERGYRVDRLLEHLQQAGIFSEAKAILFGDFLGGEEPNGRSLLPAVLRRFAENCSFPVVHIPGIGHGTTNAPVPMGVMMALELGDSVRLSN